MKELKTIFIAALLLCLFILAMLTAIIAQN